MSPHQVRAYDPQKNPFQYYPALIVKYIQSKLGF